MVTCIKHDAFQLLKSSILKDHNALSYCCRYQDSYLHSATPRHRVSCVFKAADCTLVPSAAVIASMFLFNTL